METRRTKTYIAFDGDTDLMDYRKIQGWHQDDSCSFQVNDAHEVNNARDDSLPESIIRQLKDRLDTAKNFLLIVGEKTKSNRKGILKYEINYAIRNKLPIILVFKGFSSDDENTSELWNKVLKNKIPTAIMESKDKQCIVSPFARDVIDKQLKKYTNNSLPESESGFTWGWK